MFVTLFNFKRTTYSWPNYTTITWQLLYPLLDGPIFPEVNKFPIKTLFEALVYLSIISLVLYFLFKVGTSVDLSYHCILASIVFLAKSFGVFFHLKRFCTYNTFRLPALLMRLIPIIQKYNPTNPNNQHFIDLP